MTLKNVKVTDDVKKQLDDISIEKETYNVTIQRLLNENKLLKARCDELKQDKELFFEINRMRKAHHVRHNTLLEKEDIDFLLNEGVNVFYRQHYIPTYRGEYTCTPLEVVGLISILKALYEIDIGDYDEDSYDFDKSDLFKLCDKFYGVRLTDFKGKEYDDFDIDDTLHQILDCNYREYNVKDDLLTYLSE